MITAEPVMICCSDISIIDDEVQRRADFNIFDRKRRKDVVQLRKEVLHDIIKCSDYANEDTPGKFIK